MNRATPVDLGEYPLHPPSCGVHVPVDADSSLGCDCGLEEMRRDFKALSEALRVVANSVERDRREPDKLLCHVQQARLVYLRHGLAP